MDWIWVTTWPWCVNCLSHWLQAFLTLSCLHLVWYHNPAKVSNILSQSWHVNFASIDTTSVLHLLIYPISYISAAAAPAARPRSSCATSLGLPKYFYIKILKYIPCINKYLVTWLTMSSVPARRGSTQCWGAWRAPGAGTRSCRGCRGTNLNTLTLLHSHSHSKTLTISQIGYGTTLSVNWTLEGNCVNGKGK